MNRFSATAPQKRPDPRVYPRPARPVSQQAQGGAEGSSHMRARSGRRPRLAVFDFTLENGLEIVVVPEHRTPVVTHMIWYRVGSGDEPPCRPGLAHFLE